MVVEEEEEDRGLPWRRSRCDCPIKPARGRYSSGVEKNLKPFRKRVRHFRRFLFGRVERCYLGRVRYRSPRWSPPFPVPPHENRSRLPPPPVVEVEVEETVVVVVVVGLGGGREAMRWGEGAVVVSLLPHCLRLHLFRSCRMRVVSKVLPRSSRRLP